jgi:hypothetical protein
MIQSSLVAQEPSLPPSISMIEGEFAFQLAGRLETPEGLELNRIQCDLITFDRYSDQPTKRSVTIRPDLTYSDWADGQVGRVILHAYTTDRRWQALWVCNSYSLRHLASQEIVLALEPANTRGNL